MRPRWLAQGRERDSSGCLYNEEAAAQVALALRGLYPRRQDVTGLADPFNGHIDELRIAHVQRSDGYIDTTWANVSDPGAFAAAGAEEQEGGEPPPLAGIGVVVCLMG